MKNPRTTIKFWRGLILVLFGLGVARLLVSSLDGITYRIQTDEGYYLFYGTSVLERGLVAFKDLFKTYISNSSFWGLPLPLRFGFILESALFCRIFGGSFFALSFVSIFSFFCSVFTAYWLGKRIFGRDTAFLSCLLFLASPLALGLSRRALCDSASNFFLLSVFLLQLNYYLGSGYLKRWMIAAVFFCALFFKETNILFIVPLAASSLPFCAQDQWRRLLKDWAVIYVLPALCMLFIYLLFFGPLREILAALFFLPSFKAQWYTVNFQSGPWFRYLLDFLLISPWVMILGFYYALRTLDGKSKKEELATVLFIAGVILVHAFFTKNLRYVSVADYPLRVLAILALYNFTSRSKNQFQFVFMVTALLCLVDMANFYRFFIRARLYDPVSYGLLTLWNIVPDFT